MKCSFCGNEKNKEKKIILIQGENDKAICNVCLSKAKKLIEDPEFYQNKIIHINTPLTNSVAWGFHKWKNILLNVEE